MLRSQKYITRILKQPFEDPNYEVVICEKSRLKDIPAVVLIGNKV